MKEILNLIGVCLFKDGHLFKRCQRLPSEKSFPVQLYFTEAKAITSIIIKLFLILQF